MQVGEHNLCEFKEEEFLLASVVHEHKFYKQEDPDAHNDIAILEVF